MFAVEIPAFPFYARLSGRAECSKRSRHAMEQTADSRDPQALICEALAEMVPSTAAEIAEATGLDPATAEASLERLAATCRVLFNPLTKRFSLPKAWTGAGGLAA